MEHLRLGTAHHFEIVKLEAAVEAAPGIHDEDAADGVVAVPVDGPVRDDQVGFLALDEFAHLAIAVEGHLGGAVDLVHEQRAGAGDFAGGFGLADADGRGFVVALAGNAGLPSREIDADHFVAGVGEQADGAAGGGFRIIRMRPDDEDLLAVLLFRYGCHFGRGGSHRDAQHRERGGASRRLEHRSSVHIVLLAVIGSKIRKKNVSL